MLNFDNFELFSKKNEKFIILLLTLTFSFLFNSFYHQIEQGFLRSQQSKMKNALILFLRELLKQMQLKIVSCKDVTFRIFGFLLQHLI